MSGRGRLTRTRIQCVNCNICVNTLRRYPALELDTSVTTLLCTWIHPRIITESDYVCEACRDLAMCRANRTLQQEPSGSADQQAGSNLKGHTNVCPICGLSLLSRRSDLILRDNPSELQQFMINIFESRLAPQQISVSDRVCHSCWLRTKREATRLNVIDDTRSVPSSTNSVPEGSQQDDQPYGSSKSELNPIQIIESDYVCGACRDLAMCRANLALQQEASGSADQQAGSSLKGHTNVCPVCGCSILRIKTEKIFRDNPSELQQLMIKILESRVAPRQISVSDRVCRPCWLQTRREATRLNVIDDTRSVPSSTNSVPEGSQQYDQPYGSSKSEVNPIEAEYAYFCDDDDDDDDEDDDDDDDDEDDDDDDDDDDNDDDDSDTPVESNVCRVCLALDVKMYDLKDNELREMFQNITGIAVPENNHSILERLCWECAGRLKAAAAFRNKALLSDALLQRLANTGLQIEKNDIILIKEKEDYLKLAATLSVVKVFHPVEIDPENESLPSKSKKKNETKILHYYNTRKDSKELKKSIIEENNGEMDVSKKKNDTNMLNYYNTRKDSKELKKSIIEENNDVMDVEDEPMIDAPIKTEIEYDSICTHTGEEDRNIVLETKDESMIEAPIETEIEYDPICNTDEQNRNIVLETDPLFSNNIPLREDTVNSAYSSPPPGCSHVEPKYPILGCILKTPSDCENKTKKTVVKITNSISKIAPKKSKELISHDHTYLKCDAKFKNINVKVGGISKKTSNQKLVKKTQVQANTSTDEECLSL